MGCDSRTVDRMVDIGIYFIAVLRISSLSLDAT